MTPVFLFKKAIIVIFVKGIYLYTHAWIKITDRPALGRHC